MNSKLYTFLVSLLCFSSPIVESVNSNSPKTVTEEYCAMDYILSNMREDEHGQEKLDAMEKTILTNQDGHQKTLLTLPVVVHIIHNGGVENIPDAEIIQGIQNLNDAFANFGYYDNGDGVDVEIDFCLANKDPNGMDTDGITRDVNILTDMVMETEDILLKDINRWEPKEYINIWVVNSITSQVIGPGVAGYAFFPASHGQPEDGIVVESIFVGQSEPNSAVLVHEMGHYLGLYHTFEGGCLNDDCTLNGDRVCDTPPDQDVNYYPCNTPPNTCNTDTDSGFMTDQDDMISNYMDYSDLFCYSQFTEGQKIRMRTVCETIRQSLLNAESCFDICMSSVKVLEPEIDFCQGDTTFSINIDWNSEDLTANTVWSPAIGVDNYLDDVNAEDPVITIPSNFVGDLKYYIVIDGDSIACSAVDSVSIRVHPLPEPLISGIEGTCVNGDVYYLNAMPLGGVWSGDVDALGRVDPAVLGVGTFEAEYYVTENSCGASDLFTFEIYDTTSIVIDPLSNPFCIKNGAQELTAFPTGGTWEAPVIGNMIDLETLGVGKHQLTYNYTNPSGCSTEASTWVEIIDEVQSQIVGPSDLCETGEPVNYVGIYPGGVWGGVASTTGDVDPASLVAGEYAIIYSSPPSLCNISDTMMIRIHEQPQVEVVNEISVCATGTETTVNFEELELMKDLQGFWTDISECGASGDFPVLDFKDVDPGRYTFVYKSQTAIAPCVDVQDVLIVVVPDRVEGINYTVTPLSCESQSNATVEIEVREGSGPFAFSLDGGEFQASSLFQSLSPGNYILTVRDSLSCPFYTTIDIEERPDWTLELGESQTLLDGQEANVVPEISINDSMIAQYDWDINGNPICFQCEELKFVPEESGYLVLQVTDVFGCIKRDSIFISISTEERVYIPTVFSPNGDNINDVWYVQGDQTKIEVIEELVVYNSWGNVVYSAENLDINSELKAWNGMFKGRALDPAVFAYYLRVKFKSGAIEEMTGDITLIK